MDGTGKNLTQMGITSLRIITCRNKRKNLQKELINPIRFQKKINVSKFI